MKYPNIILRNVFMFVFYFIDERIYREDAEHNAKDTKEGISGSQRV